jgi:hypothetical protein
MKRLKDFLIDLFLLLCIAFAVGALLFAVKTNKKNREHYIYVNSISMQHDTLERIKTKYKTLRDTQQILNTKYETLYIVLAGDTTCAATRRLLSMHRLLDSSGK